MPHFLGLAALPAIEAEVVYGDFPVAGDCRSALADRLHSELSRLHRPIGRTD
jgi:hypothetical protein